MIDTETELTPVPDDADQTAEVKRQGLRVAIVSVDLVLGAQPLLEKSRQLMAAAVHRDAGTRGPEASNEEDGRRGHGRQSPGAPSRPPSPPPPDRRRGKGHRQGRQGEGEEDRRDAGGEDRDPSQGGPEEGNGQKAQEECSGRGAGAKPPAGIALPLRGFGDRQGHQDGERRQRRQNVGHELRAGRGEEEEDESRPDEQEDESRTIPKPLRGAAK